ncbi:MAG TPA: prephenate dehydrogenase/arogenate dehydrogenase family protein [Vicinamibacterales bacterium]|nr:prephenate dehydrogenase/arogenate dehydrogenase family protein [Vicinamibacterales bacterium]
MKLAVIGPGLIGHSVALAAGRAQPHADIVEIDRGEPLDAAVDADVIVLAAPVDVILELIAHHAHVLGTALAIDTGSTKRAIVRAARHAGLDRFVGGHPMAGGTTSGASAARADLFEGKTWFLVPHGAAPDAVATAQTFVERLGARPVVMEDDGAEHDRVMAAVSHLPQAVASVLMTVAAASAGERLSWAGSGLLDTTRLAASDGALWQSILSSNAGELRPLLLEMSARLSRLADELDDAAVIGDLFARARRARATLEP